MKCIKMLVELLLQKNLDPASSDLSLFLTSPYVRIHDTPKGIAVTIIVCTALRSCFWNEFMFEKVLSTRVRRTKHNNHGDNTI